MVNGYFGKTYKRRTLEQELRTKQAKREEMDNSKGRKVPAHQKAKLSKEINELKKEVALVGINDTARELKNNGIQMRKKIDTDKNSGRYLLPDIVGTFGAEAMYDEARKAYNNTLNHAESDPVITAGGGSTFYRWIYFKSDPEDEEEEPKLVVKMPDPTIGKIGKENAFPTAGMYNVETELFCPLKLYTEYLKKIVWEGMATTKAGQNLLYLKCNYLYSSEKMRKEKVTNGVLHVDFGMDHQEKWKELGDPATHIICVDGQTPLSFSSVSRKTLEDADRDPKQAEVHTLKPGDGVWFSWRQYHASHIPEQDPEVPGSEFIGPNIRLQAMFSSIREDFPDESEDVVFLHGNKRNMGMYDEAEEKIKLIV